jgi:hypothetical protein
MALTDEQIREIRAIIGDSPVAPGPAPVVVPAPAPTPAPASKGGWLGHVLTAVLTLAVSLGIPAIYSRLKPGPTPPPPVVTSKPPVVPPTQPPPVVTLPPVTPPPPVVVPPPAPSDPLSVAARAYIVGIPRGFRATAADVRSNQITTDSAVIDKLGERRKAAGADLSTAIIAVIGQKTDGDGNITDAGAVASALETAAGAMEGAGR